MYAYNADTYCDACGDKLRAELDAQCVADEDDSNGYPQWVRGEPTDSPDHCASVADCAGESVDLREYGASADALVGAESCVIGELLSDELTDDGADYLREMLTDSRTPYQTALHRFWRESFADYLDSED